MHEPYEARRREREEKKRTPRIMIGGVFVRALNENRTRDLPLRRRTLYPLSYKGDGIVFAAWGDAETLYVRYNTSFECRGRNRNEECCR